MKLVRPDFVFTPTTLPFVVQAAPSLMAASATDAKDATESIATTAATRWFLRKRRDLIVETVAPDGA